MRESQPIQSVDRGLVILEAVANSTSPLSERVHRLGGNRPQQCFPARIYLEARGFLAYPAGRKDFILGPALWRLSDRYDWGTMLIRISQEYLEELVKRTNE